MASETLKRIIELDAISPTYLSSAYVPVTSYLSSDSSSSRHTYALPIGIASQDMYGLLRLIDGPTGNATDGTMTQRAIMSAIAAGELAGPTGATGASGVSVTGPTGSSGKDGTDGEQGPTGPTGPRGQSSDSVIEHLVVNGTEVPVKDKTASIALPTLVSELANDSGFINSSVADLVNYYTKAQTYTQQEIMGLIAQITSVHIEIVDALPAEGESNIIYCVPKTAGSAADGYAEWYWLSSQSRFEYFGTTDVDLSQYYNKTESDLRFVRSAYVDTSVPESPDDSHVPSTLLATKIALASGIGEYSRDTDGNIITADIFRKAEKNTGYNVDFGDGTSDMSGSAYSLCVGNGNTVKGDHNFVLGNVPAYTDGSTITGNHNIFVGESTYAFYNGNMGSVASVILNCGMGPVSCTSSVARSLITCNGYLNNTFDSVIGGNGITCHRAYSGILHGDGNEYNLIYGFVAGSSNYIGKYTTETASDGTVTTTDTLVSCATCVGNGNYIYGNYGTVFGNGNTVIKSNAFVAGSGNYALDPNVSLIGQGLVSSGDGSNSIVLGKYNNSIADMLLVLGNGSETSRSNALTVSPRGDTTAHTFIGGTYKSAASNFVVSGTGATATVAPNKHAIIGTAGVLPTEVTGQLYVVLSGTAPVSSIDCADAYEFEFTTSSSALSEVKVEYADGAPVTWSQLPPAYAASRRYVFRVYDGMLSYECYSVADEMWCHIQNNGTWVEVSHTVGSVVYGEMEGIAEPSNPNPGIIMNGTSGVYLPNGIYDFSNEYTVMVNEAYPYFIKLNIAVIAGSITLREQSFYFHGDYPGVYQSERAGGVFKINGATAANRLVRIKVSTNDVGGGSALSSGDTICLFKPSHIFLHMVR